MSITPTTPLDGMPQDDFASPTYTLAEDTPPNDNSKQWAVTAIGGTQGTADVHTVGKPFTLTVEAPKQYRAAGTPNPVTGVVSNVPYNVYKARTRKGVVFLDGQPARPAMIETRISIPAGAELNDYDACKALVSAHTGLLKDQARELGQLIKFGIL